MIQTLHITIEDIKTMSCGNNIDVHTIGGAILIFTEDALEELVGDFMLIKQMKRKEIAEVMIDTEVEDEGQIYKVPMKLTDLMKDNVIDPQVKDFTKHPNG